MSPFLNAAKRIASGKEYFSCDAVAYFVWPRCRKSQVHYLNTVRKLQDAFEYYRFSKPYSREAIETRLTILCFAHWMEKTGDLP